MARTALDPNTVPAAARPRTRRRRLLIGLALAATLGGASAALGAEATLVDATTDLTAPAGVMRDSHGDLWVSDSHGGICRVVDPPNPGGSVVVSDYCNLDPAATRIGPTAPGQLAFDPASSMFFVGDGASGSGAVWRLHLDQTQNPAVIDSAAMIVDFSNPLVADRVFGMAYHAGGDVLDFSTKNSAIIQRVTNPAACVAPCATQNIGSAEDKATGSLVHDSSGRLYIADLSGVTSFLPGSLDFQARPVAGMAGAYSALAFDPIQEGGLLYAGTTNADGADQIDRVKISTGETSTYVEPAFDAVTAIGLSGPGGGLDVFDDPGIKNPSENAGGAARHFTVGFEAFAPRPRILDGPANTTNQRNVAFLIDYPDATTFYCSLDGAPAAVCGTGTQATKAYAGLGDGAHTFRVIADNPVTGQRATRRFVVDTVAPTVTIDSISVIGSTAFVGFSANDINVDFSCTIDGSAPHSCGSPAQFGNLADGLHTVTVQGTDFPGNEGAPVATTFRVGAPTIIWRPGTVTATLRGRVLRVTFNAPPTGKFARFQIRRGGVTITTKPVRVRSGKRNSVQIVLPVSHAKRLQGKKFKFNVSVQVGSTNKRFVTNGGKGKLKIVAALGRRR